MAVAAVPPRIVKHQRSRTSISGQDSFDVLMQMGFSENRAWKAIAATGDKGVQLASDWLLSHVNDPSLDDKVDREYVVYLCPTGALLTELTTFWEKTQRLCGWNGAHLFFPHITLCPFFKANDKLIRQLSKTFANLEAKLKKLPEKIDLSFFSVQNFIGLFLNDRIYDFLKKIVLEYSAEAKKFGVDIEPPKKQFHLTCAYQYKPELHDILTKMGKEINLKADAQWEVRLYSRDPKVQSCEVRKVLKAYEKVEDDELDLHMDDFILMDPSEVNKSKDGWYYGTSWVSGISGMFPGTLTKRTAESWTWTFIKSIPLPTHGEKHDFLSKIWEDKKDDVYAKVNKEAKNRKSHPVSPRRVFVMRHGERVDSCLTKSWADTCFSDNGKYTRVNLNLPKTMLARKHHLEFIRDCPLTEIGRFQARLTGEALKDEKVTISYVFTSPALRSVQTAHEVLGGLGSDIKICIEPSLFEWLGWTQILPHWIPPEELSRQGYAVDTSYTPFLPTSRLNGEETVEQCYRRGFDFTSHIVKKLPSESGNILFVGHACSLDIISRRLCAVDTKPINTDFHSNLSVVPFCGMCMCQEEPTTKRWALLDPPVPTLVHDKNKSFQWKTALHMGPTQLKSNY